MKITYILILILLVSAKTFSQSDKPYKTEKIFYISYLDYDNEIKTIEDVSITDIDSISISFDEVTLGRTSNENKHKIKKIIFERIKAFGYKDGISMGTRTGIGAIAGFSAIFIWGAASIDFKFSSSEPYLGYIVLFSILGAVPGAVIGAATGIGQKEYETLSISQYDSKKKFEIIKRMIHTGIKKDKE